MISHVDTSAAAVVVVLPGSKLYILSGNFKCDKEADTDAAAAADAAAAVVPPGSKLYILNGNFKCHKEAGCGAGDAAPPLTLLRQIAGSFDAGSS